MPAGASPKREREYEKLKKEFKEEGRYKGREEEVASRIVNKQRAKFGETEKAQEKARKGESPDRHLAIKNYQHKTVDQVANKLDKLSPKEVREIRTYERKHKNRKTLMEQIDRRLKQKS